MTRVAEAVVSRPGGAADEILGLRPAAVFAPESLDGAAALLEQSDRDGLRLVFAGGRTGMDLGAPPRALDAVVETGRLIRVVEHAPSDQIVVVEAGVTLAALQESLAGAGQRLAIDPPEPARATIGGIVAGNAFGPLRHRYGSVRDLLIGICFIRADGTVARGGGKVVKNVAGFDLPKLLTGSLGTLGLIATATFRLHPRPEVEALVLVRGLSPRKLRRFAARLRELALEPASVIAVSHGSLESFDVEVRFEGFEAGAAEQRARCEALGGEDGGECGIPDAAAARGFREAHDAVRAGGTLRAKIAAPRSAIDAVSENLLPPLFGLLSGPRFVWYPGPGLGFFSGAPEDVHGAAGACPALLSLREGLERLGGSLVLEAAPPAVRERVDVWGTPPASIAVMRALKERFDPAGRLAPGRFVGGI
ncbi:MAG: FAD-binding oxidoreductase [Acidobacteriota bacterium]|nr:FAD-binding oxidoreductase [Acidobacteriota bacterium]